MAIVKRKINKKKRLKRKQKEIKKVIGKLPNHNQDINYYDYKQVFFAVYNNIDSLSIKQLEILREFCTLSYDPLNRKELCEKENSDRVEIYDKYRERIEDQIDMKKEQRKESFQKKIRIFPKKKR